MSATTHASNLGAIAAQARATLALNNGRIELLKRFEFRTFDHNARGHVWILCQQTSLAQNSRATFLKLFCFVQHNQPLNTQTISGIAEIEDE
jgi:hypothetical protein